MPDPAFEVHGDIRAKYNHLGGPGGSLGLPITNEMPTPDGIGRFNHFEHGSIYWTPRTGPMMVRGLVRDRWAASGWELGSLGYPVADQHRMLLLGPSPLIEWCYFENGLIAADGRGGMPSPMALQSFDETLGRAPAPALLTYSQVEKFFGGRLNAQFKASPDNVALRAGVSFTGVSEWRYGFFGSVSRSVGFRYRGFHDNGLAPDTNFAIDIRLRFELVWSMGTFTEPPTKTLVAVLESLNVGHDGGLALAQVYASVESAILHAFYDRDLRHPEVPSGAAFVAAVPTGVDVRTGYIDILGVTVTSDGSLQVLVNPLFPPQEARSQISYTALRQLAVQEVLNSLGS